LQIIKGAKFDAPGRLKLPKMRSKFGKESILPSVGITGAAGVRKRFGRIHQSRQPTDANTGY